MDVQAAKKRHSSSIRKHHRNLKTPYIENSGSYIKPLWIAKAQHYGIEARVPLLGFKNDYIMGFLNTIGSIIIAFNFIIKPDTILGCILASLYTLLYWTYGQHLAVNMSWNIISLSIIFPITQAIGMGFKRRDEALRRMGDFSGNFRSLWGGVHTWCVPSKDPNKGWVRVIEKLNNGDLNTTKENMRKLADELFTAMICYFNTNRWRRARHVMWFMQPEQVEMQDIAHEQRMRVDYCMARVQRVVQDMKAHGLPGGEAHRLDQYVSKCGIAIEHLAAFKEYRTPQAFRAFARIYIQIIGALFGPYYLYIANGTVDEPNNIGLALAFALSIQLTLSGLYHVMLGLEDPFGEVGRFQLDSVRVPELVEMLRQMVLQVEEDADADWSLSYQDKVNLKEAKRNSSGLASSGPVLSPVSTATASTASTSVADGKSPQAAAILKPMSVESNK